MRQELRAVGRRRAGGVSAKINSFRRCFHSDRTLQCRAGFKAAMTVWMLLIAVLVAGVKPSAGISWRPHAACTTACVLPSNSSEGALSPGSPPTPATTNASAVPASSTPTPSCTNSLNCTQAWDACPEGSAQWQFGAPTLKADPGDCFETGCTPGGCKEGWEQTGRELCLDFDTCRDATHFGACFRETCCRLRPLLTCCQQLGCEPEYEDCEVPQRRHPDDPASTDVSLATRIAHTGFARMPFYTAAQVPAAAAPDSSPGGGGQRGQGQQGQGQQGQGQQQGQEKEGQQQQGQQGQEKEQTGAGGGGGGGCEGVRVMGRCTCDDGRKLPYGCDPSNSSTWSGDYEGAPPLPPNLSLTCVLLPPPPAPPPLNAPAPTLPPPLPAQSAATRDSSADSHQSQSQAQATSQSQSEANGTSSAASASASASSDSASSSDSGSTTHGSSAFSRNSSNDNGGSSINSGGRVAVIVVSCLLLAALSVTGVLWCCGMLPSINWRRLWRRMKGPSAYEPVPTSQSYTAGLTNRGDGDGGGAAAAHRAQQDNTPWERFCTAVADTYGRLRYGKRYREDAAAAERYRSLSVYGSPARGSGGGGGGGGVMTPSPGLGGRYLSDFGRGGVSVGGGGGGSGNQFSITDEGDVGDEVFTLDDLGSSNRNFYSRPTGHSPFMGPATPSRPRMGGPGGSDVAASPSGSRLPTVPHSAASAAELELGRVESAPTAVGRGGGLGVGAGDVIHTRPLPISEGAAEEDDAGLDAPLELLPTPQVTGQGQRPQPWWQK